MGRQSLEGFSHQGGREDFDTTTKLSEKRFVTVIPLGVNRSGLDTINTGFFTVGAASRVAEVGSTDSQIILTGHGAQPGDLIRLRTTANTISQLEVTVKSAPDANTIELDGLLDADITAGDTFDIRRGITQNFDSDGNSLSGPVQFFLDGVSQIVTEDTVTPANNAPLPVKLTGITGDINITANDLNVQLTHTGATPDSTQIGDGTEILLISASGEALTLPSGNVADNAADSGNPIKIGGVYTAAAPTLDDGDRGNLRLDVNGRLLVADVNISTTPGTFAEDSAHTTADIGYHVVSVRQDTLASSTSTDGDYASLKSTSSGEIYSKDTDVETQLTTMNAKMTAFDLDSGGGTENNLGVNLRLTAGGGSIEAIGQQLMASSIPVVLASNHSNIPVAVQSSALPAGAATEATLALVATEVTAAAILADTASLDAKIGIHDLDLGGGTEDRQGVNLRISASGGSIEAKGSQTSANSIPVVLASDQVLPAEQGIGARQFIRNDYSSTSVTSGAFVELTASLTQDMDKAEIFDSSGQTLEIATGAAASEVVRFRVFPGGNGFVPLDRAIFASGTRISIRAVSATADAGEININFYSN